MKNIIQSITYSLIGLATISWIGIYLIVISVADPGPDSYIVGFFSDNIMSEERIQNLGFDNFAEISTSFFTKLFFHMNLTLAILTTSMTLAWCVASHYLNIDSPGKAKIYALHWLVFTGIFVGLVLAIVFYFTGSTQYSSAQAIKKGGQFLLLVMSLLIYVLPYYLGVLLGTARFARSSVLFANKLPGGF